MMLQVVAVNDLMIKTQRNVIRKAFVTAIVVIVSCWMCRAGALLAVVEEFLHWRYRRLNLNAC